MRKNLSQFIDSTYHSMHDSFGYFYIKDLNGRFLYMNESLLRDAGCKMSELIGKTDSESCWGEYAELYRAHDFSVMSQNKCLQVRGPIETSQKEVKLIVSHTKPFYLCGEMIGVCGSSLTLPEAAVDGKIPYSDHLIFFDFTRKKTLILSNPQKKVLFHLLQGCTSKEVALTLFLSKRTVENYAGIIKDNNEYNSLKEMLISVRPI